MSDELARARSRAFADDADGDGTTASTLALISIAESLEALVEQGRAREEREQFLFTEEHGTDLFSSRARYRPVEPTRSL